MLSPMLWMVVYLIQSTPAEIKRGKKQLHYFFLYGMLFSRPGLNIFFFYRFSAENILSVLFLNFIAYVINFPF